MPHFPFEDPSYLMRGSEKQQQAFNALSVIGVFTTLAAFTPVLAGTVPLGIDTDESDLDILCQYHDKDIFAGTLNRCYGHYPDFKLWEKEIAGGTAVVASFIASGFVIEVFGQNQPVREQYGYLHLVKEAEILTIMGNDFRESVIKLKKLGSKTEPAFAKLLKLQGDPYKALLAVDTMLLRQTKALK